MAGQVTGFVDCGQDVGRLQKIVYLPAVREIDVLDLTIDLNGNVTSYQVTLYYHDGAKTTLGPEHSAKFLEVVGLRTPTTNRIVVPDIAAPRFGKPS